jgi:hypothetical protein
MARSHSLLALLFLACALVGTTLAALAYRHRKHLMQDWPADRRALQATRDRRLSIVTLAAIAFVLGVLVLAWPVIQDARFSHESTRVEVNGTCSNTTTAAAFGSSWWGKGPGPETYSPGNTYTGTLRRRSRNVATLSPNNEPGSSFVMHRVPGKSFSTDCGIQ